MKRRIFYVFHLDRNRILFLFFTFLSLLLFSFSLGRYLGQTRFEQKGFPQSEKLQDFPLFSLKEAENSKRPPGSESSESLAEAKTEPHPAKDRSDPRTINQEVVILRDEEAGEVGPPSRPRQSAFLQNSTDPRNSKNSEGSKYTGNTRANKAIAPAPQIVTQRAPYKKASLRPAPQKTAPKRKSAAKKLKKTSAKKVLLTQAAAAKKRRARSLKKSKQKKGTLRLSNINKKSFAKSAQIDTKANSYHLQLGAFRSRDAAQRMQKELKAQGFRARIKEKKDIYLVQIGQKLSLEDIQKIEGSLRQEKYFPIRVREVPN